MDGYTIDSYKKIEQLLKRQLPGQKAQLRMAPTDRPSSQSNRQTRNAGVLLLLYERGGELHTILTRRAVYEGAHSGQVSLPGGKFEMGDRDLFHTALGETHEEIGVIPHDIRIIGKLTPLYIPVSNHMVQPVIGRLTIRPRFIPDDKEVTEIYEIRIADLLKPDCLITNEGIMENNRMINAPFYRYNGIQIWGATAMILSEFLELYSQSHP